MTLFDDKIAPITSRIGLIEATPSNTLQTMTDWMSEIRDITEIEHLDCDLGASWRRLTPLSITEITKHLIVQTTEPSWTAVFDNLARGGNQATTVSVLSRVLQTRGLVVISVPEGKPNNHLSNRWGSEQFRLVGLDGQDSRWIALTQDGNRWRFGAGGEVQDFEQTTRYGARRVKDRFTSEMISDYCRSLGVDVFNPEFYAGPSELISLRKTSKYPGVSLAEAREFYGLTTDTSKIGAQSDERPPR